MYPWIARALVLTAGGLALGGLAHLARFGTFFVASTPAEVCATPADSAPIELHPQDAASLCASADVVVLDVRPAESFAAGHIAEAVHLPCSAGRIEARLSTRLEAAYAILVYGKATEDARAVAESLAWRRFADVFLLSGGYPAWDAAGHACASGPCEHCEAEHP